MSKFSVQQLSFFFLIEVSKAVDAKLGNHKRNLVLD